MARVIGIDIPNNKRLVISLTYIYGIGRTRAEKIIADLKLDPNVRVKDLDEATIATLNAHLQKYQLEGDLRREVQGNVKRLVNIGAYRGLRHRTGLAVRGQGTRTNSRTRKGRKKTVAGKKK